MKSLWGGILVLALLAGCSGAKVVKKQGVEMPQLQFALRSLTYPSGLRVLVERDTRTKLAGVFVVVGAGSTSDPAGKEGLAHYVEHLTFRSRPGGGRPFRASLEDSGAFFFNARTSFDSTTYYELGAASDLPGILRLEGARMLDPVAHVPDAVLATELDVVKNELRQRNDTGHPGDVIAAMQAAVFPKDHPYARPIIGTLDSIGALRASDVKAFVDAQYRPRNMTVLVIGDIPLETSDRLIAENFPRELLEAPSRVRIPQRMPVVAPPAPESPAQPSELERRTAPVNAPQIWIGWSLPRSFDANGHLLEFVRQAAQQRLARVASGDKDIASVHVIAIRGVEASLLVCHVVLRQNAHPEQSRDRVLDELPQIWTSNSQRAENVSEYVFSLERRMVTVDEVSRAQNLLARGLKRATISHFSQDPAVYSREVRDLTTMRRKQLADFATPYLTRERARSVLFVPREGTLATTAPAEGIETATVADPDAEVRPVSLEPADGTDPAKVAERLSSLFLEGESATLRLPNGLTVILQRRTGLPLVSAGLVLPAVPHSIKESAAAAMAFLTARPDHVQNASPALFGGLIRETLTPDSIVYTAEGASGNAEALIATLGEYAQSVTVAKRDWVSTRKAVMPYFKRSEQEPDAVASRKLLGSVLRGTGYGLGPTAANLEETSQDDVRDWIQRTHTPAAATLSVVGDFDPKEMAIWVAESFGNWSGPSEDAAPAKSAIVAAARTPDPSEQDVLVSDRPGVTQTHLEFACLLPRADGEVAAERYAVGASILQERLYKLAREELGATYGPNVQARVRRGGVAYLQVSGLVEPGKLTPVLGAVKRTVASIGTQPASADELAAAKMRIAGLDAAGQMTNLGIVRRHLVNARLGRPETRRDVAAALAAVSADDVRTGFQSCLSANPTLSLVGDEKSVRAAVQAGWR